MPRRVYKHGPPSEVARLCRVGSINMDLLRRSCDYSEAGSATNHSINMDLLRRSRDYSAGGAQPAQSVLLRGG